MGNLLKSDWKARERITRALRMRSINIYSFGHWIQDDKTQDGNRKGVEVLYDQAKSIILLRKQVVSQRLQQKIRLVWNEVRIVLELCTPSSRCMQLTSSKSLSPDYACRDLQPVAKLADQNIHPTPSTTITTWFGGFDLGIIYCPILYGWIHFSSVTDFVGLGFT